MAHKRIYQRDAQWYFKVRGDRTCGPFVSYAEVERELGTFIKDCKKRIRLRIDWSRIGQFLPFKLGTQETQ